MKTEAILHAQKKILEVVAGQYPQVYLVGGTGIGLLYHHRFSEDLDFFMQTFTGKIHLEITKYIRRKTGFSFGLITEEKRRKFLPMAIYEFDLGSGAILKVDFVKDVVPIIYPRDANGIANIEDIYYRKILAVIGWKAGESVIGSAMAGGRQKTKDLFDVFYLSNHVHCLSEWFPRYFDRDAYGRLAAWYFAVSRQKATMELLDLVSDCDTKAVFRHLDDEIIHKLNKVYVVL